MKAQQGGGLENYGRADQPTRAKEPKPEEEAVGGVKIGRSAAGALQDQSCRFKRILSARTARVPPVPRRTASPASRCTSHTIVFFMSKQLARHWTRWQESGIAVARPLNYDFAMYSVVEKAKQAAVLVLVY
jgi:hypothetical protein